MKDMENSKPAPNVVQAENTQATPCGKQQPSVATAERREARRWWIKLFLQPALFLACGAALIAGLGWAQHMGWVSAGGGGHNHASSGGGSTRYICPMMCTPPQSEPGRCPVCAMELVAATAGAGQGGSTTIQIDPVARRVANIETQAVSYMPMSQTVRVVGKLQYDEGTLKTLSAYVDGRLDELYADYTGVVVEKGDHLALVYSPELYSGQVEMLLAKRSLQESQSSTLRRVALSNQEIYQSSKQRLIELGMTEAQIDEIEREGKATSRLHLCAPISGTVIKKLAMEGQYVKEGQAIYELADLSTVWLMLELFPEDAARIRYGQKVTAEVQSLPGRKFTGRVAFIDPQVDSKTRTVSVRVVIPNSNGQLRVGDYAKATIQVPLGDSMEGPQPVYDPQLANKWISPRHPHVVESSPGKCRICGVNLVPASRFGFTEETQESGSLVVPRSAVLMAGNNSVIYVETEIGRFELRQVVLGPSCGDKLVILKGVKAGEQVATKGNFLIDSQMQLAGNPSLIDPTKAVPRTEEELTPLMIAAIDKLPQADRMKAKQQRICPVTKMPLGSMGTPIKIPIDGKNVFICCKGCEQRLRDDPQTLLANLDNPKSSSRDDSEEFAKALAQLTPGDMALVKSQRVCPVADMQLGSMGPPQKVDVNGQPVFICCEACRESLLEDPEKYLAKLKFGSMQDFNDEEPMMNLPPIGVPEAIKPLEDENSSLHDKPTAPINRIAIGTKEGVQ